MVLNVWRSLVSLLNPWYEVHAVKEQAEKGSPSDNPAYKFRYKCIFYISNVIYALKSPHENSCVCYSLVLLHSVPLGCICV